MFQLRLRLAVMLVVVTAVLAVAAPPVIPQEGPPRPHRTIEQIPRWPEAPPSQFPESAASADVFDFHSWSTRVWQNYRFGKWDILRKAYNDHFEVGVVTSHAADIHPRLNRGATDVVFASNHGDGVFEIYRVDIDGASPTRLTYSGSNNLYPAWSPDGRKIVFQSYRDNQAEIYVMNADGSGQTRLTNNPGFDGMPNWSPDGRKIAFTSLRGGHYYIYVMNADGSGVTRLSNQPYSANPTWSPDGAKIAYDADLDGDGFQELWMMNADGSGQRLLYDPPGQADAWARSWSNRGQWINYTHIRFVYQQGVWYWVDAFLDAYVLEHDSTWRMSYSGVDWHPDWQSADIIPPTSTIRPLPAQSIYQFHLSWSAQDVGPSGISWFDLRYKAGADSAWTTLLDQVNYDGYEFQEALGGQTYYFQVRAHDRAGNVEAWKDSNIVSTTIENQPPQTDVRPLPPFTRVTQPLRLDWTGFDRGGSGVAEYEIQYRIDRGRWVNWGAQSEESLLFENPTPGKSYYFQVRGVDRAQNRESWIGGDGNASTTVYATAISGVVQDNGGAPVQGITLATTPATFHNVTGDADGRYAGYFASQPAVYSVNWSKEGYGPLPTTLFDGAIDVQQPIVLPPVDNLVGNSGFETGVFAPEWMAGGSVPPRIAVSGQHTGQYAAYLSQGDAPFVNGRLLGNGNNAPQIILDSSSTPHAVWVNNGQLLYTQRAGDEWLAPQVIANNVSDRALLLAADGANTLHLIWQPIGGNVRYAQRPAGGDWSTPETVRSSPDYTNELQMVVTPAGIVHVLWKAKPPNEDGLEIYYRRRDGSGAWTTVENASNTPTGGYSGQSRMAVDAQNTVHVTWSEMVIGGGLDVFYARRPAGGGWSTRLNISRQPYQYSVDAELAVEANGVLHAVWSDSYDIYHARRALNGTWSAPYRVTGNRGSSLVRLSLDDAENLHLIIGPGWESHHVTRSKSGTWSSPVALPHSNILQAVPDRFGLVHLVYQKLENGQAYYSQETPNGWTPPQPLIGQAPANAFYEPHMVIDDGGAAHLVWRDYSFIYYAGPAWATTADTTTLSQSVTIPADMATPTLSFLYQAGGVQNSASRLRLALDDGVNNTTLWNPAENSLTWRHTTIDLTPWAGQTVRLTFRLAQAADAPLAWAALDEITLGAAHPDVWVTADRTSALPNEQATHTLTYGNRGGAAAAQARLTYTLPPELAFVSASPPPVSTAPLVWELGDLPVKSAAQTLTVTVRVAPSAAPFSTLSSTAVIAVSGPELETLNNSAQGLTFVGRSIYLPLIVR